MAERPDSTNDVDKPVPLEACRREDRPYDSHTRRPGTVGHISLSNATLYLPWHAALVGHKNAGAMPMALSGSRKRSQAAAVRMQCNSFSARRGRTRYFMQQLLRWHLDCMREIVRLDVRSCQVVHVVGLHHGRVCLPVACCASETQKRLRWRSAPSVMRSEPAAFLASLSRGASEEASECQEVSTMILPWVLLK